MKYAWLGSTGLKVSRLCLGMMSYGNPADRSHPSWRDWHLEESAAEPLVRRAAEAGVTFFDTADMYAQGASEQLTGSLMRRIFAHREDYVLATKVYYPMGPGPHDRGLSRRHILDAVDASLRRLGTDHIDLYQVHRWDYGTPVEETMAALDEVVRAGKVRFLGASSMYAWQFAKAQHIAESAGQARFVSMQNHYNLVYREEEREMIPLCAGQGVAVLPYSPLARGLLAGTRERRGGGSTSRSTNDPLAGAMYRDGDFEVVDAVGELAAEHGLPPAQIALAWLLAQPAVTAPVVGVTKPHHIDDALAAVELPLGEEEMRRLEAPYRPHPVLGHE
ncbi:MAG TPA: aldo/keto reductase [Streptomyces sp.]|jgi:aryl-alcohol dehydrogenase-like predicted oxidoreductase|nr:aldo/keto reductase [Streptomyces sp.]